MKKQNIKSLFSLCIVHCALCIITNAQSWNTTGNAGTNASANYIGTSDNHSFAFRTNNTNRIYVDSTGKVGIGTSSPTFNFQFNGGKFNLSATSTTASSFIKLKYKLEIQNSTTSTTFATFDAINKRVGIGVTAPSHTLDVTGSTNVTGNFINTGTSINNYGVYGTCNNTPEYGIGVNGDGGWAGVYGSATKVGNGQRIGVWGYVSGGTDNFALTGYATGGTNAYGIAVAANNGSNSTYGINASATGSGGTTAYGILASASGAGTNWAGYFDNGNVYVKNLVGIGNTSPAFALDVASNLQYVGKFVNTSVSQGYFGLYGSCATSPDNGIGVRGDGGFVGVDGQATVVGSGDRFGVRALATSGSGSNYGVAAYATGPANVYGLFSSAAGTIGSTTYALYAGASGGNTNWAGYFGLGNVYVQNKVGINNLTPFYALDVKSNQSTAAFFNNTSTSQNYYGSQSFCNNSAGFGTGVQGNGGYIGVHGSAGVVGTGTRYGLYGYGANGTDENYGTYGAGVGGNVTYGVVGEASDASTYNYGVSGWGVGGNIAYGVYAKATGGITNWAGYFAEGNVHIQYNLGIGTTAPTAPLHVVNNGSSAYACMIMQNLDAAKVSGMQILNNTGTLKAHMGYGNTGSVLPDRFYAGTISADPAVFTTTDTERMRITAIGRVGIGVTAPGGLFELSLDQGRKPSTNTWTVTSDARLKNIDGSYTKGLKEVLQLNPVAYHYKNAGERKFADEVLKTANVGFIAQEVQKIFPEAVGVDEDGYLNFNMHSILVAYANAFKEQQQQIETKDEAIKSLQTENIELKSRMDKFEAALSQCCMSYKSGVESSELRVADAPKLEQNTPNPFSENTVIRFYIPQNSGYGVIKVYSMDGSELISIPVSAKGFNQTEISGNTLSAGTYTYTLLLDGKIVDTKQMILISK